MFGSEKITSTLVRTLMMMLIVGSTAWCKRPAHSKSTKNSQAVSSNPVSVHDVVTTSFSSYFERLRMEGQPKSADVLNDIRKVEKLQQLRWTTSQHLRGLQELVNQRLSAEPEFSACRLVDKDEIYIFHISHWLPVVSDNQLRIVSSGWYAYKVARNNTLRFTGFSGSGDQLIYGKSKALIIGISGFDSPPAGIELKDFTEQYETTVAQGTPENVKALGHLIAALGGFTLATSAALRAPAGTPIFISVGCQPGSTKLPYTLTVTNSIQSKSSKKTPKASAGQMSCLQNGNETPCVSMRSFISQDREWWDVSIGITIPGTRESTYAFSNDSVQMGVVRHTDLYGMVDFFPAAKWLSKGSWAPHFVVGLPVTSQSLHRPFFGLSENVTGWTHLQEKLSFPVPVSVFGGLVYMKTRILTGAPTTQTEFNNDLKDTWVWKPVFGIEVSVSALASKIGKK